MDFETVWERVKQATKWRRQGDMATFLDVTDQTISGAKGRGTFPLEWAFKISGAFNVSTDWLMRGVEQTYGDQTGLTEEETILLEIYNDLSDDYKDELITSLRALIDLDQDSKKKRVVLLEKLRKGAG